MIKEPCISTANSSACMCCHVSLLHTHTHSVVPTPLDYGTSDHMNGPVHANMSMTSPGCEGMIDDSVACCTPFEVMNYSTWDSQ